MFAKSIVLSDAFLDMGLGSRALYMTLCMLSDDEGVVNSPKSIMRQCGATIDDLNVLIAKKFVLPFEKEGLVVIKHWYIHNYIQSDRFKPSKYKEVIGTLSLDENKSYTQKCEQIDDDVCPKKIESKKFVAPTVDEVKDYIKENDYNVDYLTFFRYYDASGWKDKDGKPVKNWKQKVITWSGRENSRNPREKEITTEDSMPTYNVEKNPTVDENRLNELLARRHSNVES